MLFWIGLLYDFISILNWKTNMYSLLFLFVWFWASTVLMTDPDHWTVLILTSSGYENYRHQADVCHAYQIMNKRSILRSHIAHRRTKKLIKVVRNHYLISQLLKSFVFYSKRKIHSWLTIMFSEMMKFWMVDIDLEGSTTSKDT